MTFYFFHLLEGMENCKMSGKSWGILRLMIVAILSRLDWSTVIPLIRVSEFQIRRGIEDNTKAIFSYFSMETYVVTPH